MKRLNRETVGQLPAAVRVPSYDLRRIIPGMVHLGVGAFHRAHQAVYCDQLLGRGDHDRWAISGVSLRRADTRDALRPQDGLYTVAVRDESGDTLRVVGAVCECLVAPEQPRLVLERLTSATVDVVTLTVTEKGYCHDPGSGELDRNHPDIVHDLAHPEHPRSVPGYLVAALRRRKDAGDPPFTVVCCDNLPHNGDLVRGVVCAYASALDDRLASWIEAQVAFPSTMVDRIVPATSDEDVASVGSALGAHDAWPVVCEPFCQWVIEDRFVGARPSWEASGAQLVADVTPYELMKLRLLNGCHSALAYLGYLGGYETIADAMGNPHYRAFIQDFMKTEIASTLSAPTGIDLTDYQNELVGRFTNAAIRHRTWQIAMDGSQKLPQRLLGTIRDRLAAGKTIDHAALGVAAWIRYISGRDENGASIEVRDPLAADLRRRYAAGQGDAERIVSSVIEMQAIFGDDLPANPDFTSVVSTALRNLLERGAREAVALLAARTYQPQRT